MQLLTHTVYTCLGCQNPHFSNDKRKKKRLYSAWKMSSMEFLLARMNSLTDTANQSHKQWMELKIPGIQWNSLILLILNGRYSTIPGVHLTNWGRAKINAILQTFSKVCSLMKMFIFWFKFRCDFLLKVRIVQYICIGSCNCLAIMSWHLFLNNGNHRLIQC